jgi:hypothetical protein
VELLETRLALSWAGVPPSTIAVPSNALAVTLNNAGDATGNATIATTEVDYYRFTAPVTGSYRLSATTPTSNLDPVLGVFSSTGQRLAFNDDISSTNRDSQLTTTLTAGRTYYVGITNYTGTGGGSYSWLVDGPSRDDTFEENDTRATASNLGALTARRTQSGLILADGADWFRFEMRGAGTTANFVSATFTHAQGDIDLRLYDVNGTLLRTSDSVTNEERISLNGLAAGTYFVQVYGYQGATNPNYTLTIDPGLTAPPSSGFRTLYLNFDGATISRADLVRYAGSDWAGSVNSLDADANGITVQRFLGYRADREQVIARLTQLVQEDLAPFGVTVRRHTGLAVEGQNTTTIFLGPSSLTNGNYHVASDVDFGNNNRTDIAFVGDEDWGSTERTALALADVTLHEAGHTYGLWHVNSGTALESMGLRYSINDQNQWVQNTRFLDQTFNAYVDPSGFAHGPGPQNSFQSLRQVFGLATGAPVGGATTANPSRRSMVLLAETGEDRAIGLALVGTPAPVAVSRVVELVFTETATRDEAVEPPTVAVSEEVAAAVGQFARRDAGRPENVWDVMDAEGWWA